MFLVLALPVTCLLLVPISFLSSLSEKVGSFLQLHSVNQFNFPWIDDIFLTLCDDVNIPPLDRWEGGFLHQAPTFLVRRFEEET